MANPLSIPDLQKTQTFQNLPDRYRSLVVEYLKAIAAGEPNPKTLAMQRAGYHCKSVNTAKVMGCVYFSKPAIVACLALAMGQNAREAFGAELEAAMRSPKLRPSRVAALRLYAETMGWLAPATPGKKVFTKADLENLTLPVGSLVQHDGKTYRVEVREVRTGI